jgi:uncharacterized protein (DUF2141 family)
VDTLRDVQSADASDSLDNLPAGTYYLTVFDNYDGSVIGQPSCARTETIVVGTQDGPDAFIASYTDITCNGASDGTATADASGGVLPYDVLWSTSETTLSISGLAAGTYTVTITDDNGCSDTAQVTITEPAPIEFTFTVNDATCDSSDGSATAHVSGGTGPFVYEWFDEFFTPVFGPSNDSTVTGLAAGTYYVQAMDVNACVNFDTVIVGEVGCETVLNLKLYIEGYYLGGGFMQPVFFNIDGVSDPNLTDTILVGIYDPMSPGSPLESAYGIVNVDGTCSLTFSGAINGGSYYIGITHRNAIETWSKLPITFSALTSYDFTTGSGQAYDDGFNLPMKEMEPGVWAFYNGDISDDFGFQDGTIDALDMSVEEIDANNFEFGYNPTDLNGDGASDALDMTIIENNANLFIFEAHP